MLDIIMLALGLRPSYESQCGKGGPLEPKDVYGTSSIGAYKNWRMIMSVGTIILIILVIALLGGFSGIGGGPFYGTGYYGGGGLGLVIVILLILLLLGKL